MKSVFNRAPRRPSGFSRLAAGCVPIIAVTTLIAMQSGASAAQAPVNLGTAASFAVLAGTTVTNTGSSTINGDLGVDPGTAVTGFPPGTLNGTQHDADAVALQAQSDLTTAYNDAASRTPAASAPADLSGETLAPGVYKNATSLGLTGTVTLNAEGNPDAVFIFQAGSTLITGSGSHVALTGGAQACNVFWQVGSSATLGTNSTFVGNILALQSISVTTGATIDGRALARNGAGQPRRQHDHGRELRHYFSHPLADRHADGTPNTDPVRRFTDPVGHCPDPVRHCPHPDGSPVRPLPAAAGCPDTTRDATEWTGTGAHAELPLPHPAAPTQLPLPQAGTGSGQRDLPHDRLTAPEPAAASQPRVERL